jgi:FdhD protein
VSSDAGDDPLVRRYPLLHRSPDGCSARDDAVAHEEPLEIQINGASLAVLMRTPGNDEELVRGFLITERIAQPTDIASLRHCTTVPHPDAEENIVQVHLRPDVPFDLERLRRHMFASSSCGVCGKATIEHACATAGPVNTTLALSTTLITRLPLLLRAQQRGFNETGGLHAAGLFDADGQVIAVREDVGRHNAVDKVVGACAAGALEHGVLLVSGRVSFEIVQKAAAARIPFVGGVSAPTSLAVRLADALQLTLVGFVRNDSFNVYTGAQRIVDLSDH